jgi:cyclophilin family peptidyl-prolyl cis-trans isomerase
VISSAEMRRTTILLAVALGLAGCGGSGSSHKTAASAPATTSPAATSTSTTPTGAPHCRTVPTPSPKPGEEHLKAPTLKLDPSKTYTVTVATNCGTFAFTLDVKTAPKTSASFYSLVKRGFFDGLTFHRVAAGFVIQGGDPAGDGSGGPGYQVVEPPPRNTQYVQGDVAMAKTQSDPPGASGSQFFVVTGANVTQSAGLTPDYALVGKVVSGQTVVGTIGALPTNPPGDGAPSPTVVMRSVTVKASS